MVDSHDVASMYVTLAGAGARQMIAIPEMEAILVSRIEFDRGWETRWQKGFVLGWRVNLAPNVVELHLSKGTYVRIVFSMYIKIAFG